MEEYKWDDGYPYYKWLLEIKDDIDHKTHLKL